MPTLNQYAARVANLLNQPFNNELKERVKDAFRGLRANRIRQSVDKYGIDDILKQSYVVETMKVDSNLDSCARVIGCNILRSVNKIAKPVRFNSDEPFTFVGTTDGITFVYSDIGTVRKMKALPMIGMAVFYIYENDYIYLYGNVKLKEFRVQTIFANIEEVISYCDSNNGCYTDDMEFPLPLDMEQSIITELLSKEFGLVKLEDKEVTINEDSK